MRVGAHEGG